RDKYNKRIGRDEVRESVSNYNKDNTDSTNNSSKIGGFTPRFATFDNIDDFKEAMTSKTGLKDAFDKLNINGVNNKVNSSMDKINKVRKIIIGIVIVNMLAAFIPIVMGIIGASNEINNEKTNKNKLASKNLYNNFVKSSDIMAKDYMNVLELINDNTNTKITISDIVNNTTVKEENTDTTECKYLSYNKKYALNCVISAHKKQETYNNALDELHDLYRQIYDNKYLSNKNDLIDLYNEASDLFYLPYSSLSYEKYKENYDEIIESINEIIDEN
ncbi:MAG TPA: hypothetical protein PLV83_02455, partial [Bacilli bacterium]|nr:hypothetical protein [Bacilli bacterium]